MEERGLIAAEWGITELNRKAKFYRLTTAGKKQLRASQAYWARFADAGRQSARHRAAHRMNASWRRYLGFWGVRVERDVDEELAFHIEMLVRDYVARGMSEDRCAPSR